MKKRSFTYLALLILLVVSVANSQPTRVDIKPVEKEHFIYYFDDLSLIETADSVLNKTRERLIELINDTLDYKPSIYLLDDESKFEIITRGRIPHWGAGAAFPSRKLIAIKSPTKYNINRSLEELLMHEYSHLALAARVGFNSVPRWFNEGLAMYVSMEWSWSDNLTLSRASVFGQILLLSEIEKLNRFSETKAHVAYSQSYMAVKYFFDEQGPEALNIFLDNIASGVKYSKALKTATGYDAIQFDNQVYVYLIQHYNVVSLFMDTIYLWIFLALVVVYGFVRNQSRKKEYYKKWEEEEKLHSTDFDYGDPDNPEQTDDEEPWQK